MFELYEFLKQGGWPMIPLAVCSIAGLTIVIERAFALRRGRIIPARIVELLDTYQGEAFADALGHACRRTGGAFPRIIEEILKARKLDHAHAIEAMHATGRREVAGMERGLIILEIVAGISPLIGLLGTVLGMVTVFNAISAHGIGNPQVLSEGISKALVTTVAGLCIAIPALAFHSFFSKRVESFAVEMQELATGFMARLYGSQIAAAAAPPGHEPFTMASSRRHDG